MLLVYVTAGPRPLLLVVYEPGAHITLQCNASCKEEQGNGENVKLPALVPKNGIATPLGEIPAHVLNCWLLSLFLFYFLPACSFGSAPLQYFNDAQYSFCLPPPDSLCIRKLKSAVHACNMNGGSWTLCLSTMLWRRRGKAQRIRVFVTRWRWAVGFIQRKHPPMIIRQEDEVAHWDGLDEGTSRKITSPARNRKLVL